MDYKKEFQKVFEDELCYKNGLSRKSAWEDLMMLFAIDISNLEDIRKDVVEKRKEMFKGCKERLGGVTIPLKLLNILTEALLEDPSQDFLGEIYMKIGGEKCLGQDFTPYNVCQLMSAFTLEGVEEKIKENGYITTADPTLGSGAMILAAADYIRKKGYDPSATALFFGQDIDRTCVNMTYVQLSLTGCAAVLAEGDTLANPYTGNTLFMDDDDNLWYTPAFYFDEWNERRRAYIKKHIKKEIA